MSKQLLTAIGAGAASVMIALPMINGSSFGLMLYYVAALPLYLAGLALGPTAGFIAAVSSVVLAGVLGGTVLAGVFGLSHAVPAVMIMRRALMQAPQPPAGTGEWYPVGRLLAGLSGIGALVILFAVVWAMQGATPLSEVISAGLTEFGDQSAFGDLPLAEMLTPILPGMMAASWVTMAIVNAAIAQNILVKAGRNARPSPEYADLRLPEGLNWAIIAAALAALILPGEFGYAARNIVLVLAAPYFFAGLGACHRWARNRSHPTATLVVFYILLILFGWPMLFVTGYGMLDQWRKRPSKGGSPQT